MTQPPIPVKAAQITLGNKTCTAYMLPSGIYALALAEVASIIDATPEHALAFYQRLMKQSPELQGEFILSELICDGRIFLGVEMHSASWYWLQATQDGNGAAKALMDQLTTESLLEHENHRKQLLEENTRLRAILAKHNLDADQLLAES